MYKGSTKIIFLSLENCRSDFLISDFFDISGGFIFYPIGTEAQEHTQFNRFSDGRTLSCKVIVILDEVTYYKFSSPECQSEKVDESDSDESDEETEYQACCCMYYFL